jgi:DNA-binding transcriptional LysR family regulator
MEIQQLRFFEKVYKTHSYTHAADELLISRQTLRYSIRMLEEQLGVVLFALNGKTLTPTVFAQILHQSCQETLKLFDRKLDLEKSSIKILQLRYFVAVYKVRSYTKVASELFISRQALRRSIRRLESELGTTLFTMYEKTLIPTTSAKLLYNGCLKILKSFDKMEEEFSLMKLGRTGKIRRGMLSGMQDFYTRDVTMLLRAQYAKQSIIFVGSNERLKQLLAEGELDVAYVFSAQPTCDEFDYICLRGGNIFLMVNWENELSKQSTVRISDLRNVPFATQGSEYDLHRLIEKECKREGFAPDIAFTSSDIFDISGFVDANQGVSYSVTSDIRHYNAPNVDFVPFEEEQMSWYMLEISAKKD